MFLENKIITVTHPDYFFDPNNKSLCLIDVDEMDINILIDYIQNLNITVVLYLCDSENDNDPWIINNAIQSSACIIDMTAPNFCKGFLLNYRHVFYYNSISNLASFSTNLVTDVLDVAIMTLKHEDTNG